MPKKHVDCDRHVPVPVCGGTWEKMSVITSGCADMFIYKRDKDWSNTYSMERCSKCGAMRLVEDRPPEDVALFRGKKKA